MIKVVIIGNSAAGFSACDTFVKSVQGFEITVISQENCPAYKRNLLLEYLAGKITEKELFLCDDDFYAKHKIRFLKDAKVVRIDAKKQILTLKDNSKINYDYLVIASGQKINIPDIPGSSKEGVFSVYNKEDIENIRRLLVISDTVCIAGEPEISLRLAQILGAKNKEIKVISKSQPASFTPMEKLEWISHLELAEFIGETAQLQALKLSNGKVIGTSLVLFAGNYLACTDFLGESKIRTLEGYIIVNDSLQTNWENIFAAGSVSRKENLVEKEKNWEDSTKEGILAAQNLMQLSERTNLSCQRKF